VRQWKKIQAVLYAEEFSGGLTSRTQCQKCASRFNRPTGKESRVRYLLNVFYLFLLAVFAPWLCYACWRHGKYRRGLLEKFLGRVPARTGQRPCIWFHAVSAGEVNLLKSLADRIEQEFPAWECVISTTTQTGFEMARRRHPSHTVFFCPLDFSWSVEQAMRRVRPDVLVLLELELWPNLIGAAKRHGAKTAVVNARLSDRSFRGYRRVGWLVRHVLQRVDVITAQNKVYAGRFRQLGASSDRIHVTGSLKFDGAQTDRNNIATQRLARLAGIGPRDVVFLAGSTQAPEEALALQTYLALVNEHPQLRLILVPRHPERFSEVAKLLSGSGRAWQRRSRLESTGGNSLARILLVDTMGELAAWWGTARIAYVGGSMGSREGQNMIEPAAYSAAVSFGPRTANFRDVVELLLDHEAGVVVRNGAELEGFVRRCLEDPQGTVELGRRAQRLVTQQQGAADQTVQHLARLVGNSRSNQSSVPQASNTSSASPSRIESSSAVKACSASKPVDDARVRTVASVMPAGRNSEVAE